MTNVPILVRIKLAYHAFMLLPFKHCMPYKFHRKIIPNAGNCDNQWRLSGCKNRAKIALANPSIEIILKEAEHFYHVCEDCAAKYIDSMDKEDYDY
jgi:hypothetical protein